MHVCKSERPKTKDLSLRTEKGFTLIELSIVIVIIGLIVAGIVGGQALVKQAKLRSVINQINQYKIAYNSFYLEYGKIPGDMDNATSYWPGLTSDGNGNRRIICYDTTPSERFLVWQHLQLAGYINGNFDGDAGCPSTATVDFDIDQPSSKLNKSHIRMSDYSTIYQNGPFHWLLFTGYRTNSINRNQDGILLAREAKSLDEKIDDGIANTGIVFGLKERNAWASANSCVIDSYGVGSWEDVIGSDYYLQETIPRCTLGFKLDK